jgi:DNA-binding response OmpR family regulator
VLRRTKGEGDRQRKHRQEAVVTKLKSNFVNYELKVNAWVVDTPPKELELIYHFASNPNRVTRATSFLGRFGALIITAIHAR